MCSSLRRLAERKDSISCILPQAFFMELIYADFTLLQVCQIITVEPSRKCTCFIVFPLKNVETKRWFSFKCYSMLQSALINWTSCIDQFNESSHQATTRQRWSRIGPQDEGKQLESSWKAAGRHSNWAEDTGCLENICSRFLITSTMKQDEDLDVFRKQSSAPSRSSCFGCLGSPQSPRSIAVPRSLRNHQA